MRKALGRGLDALIPTRSPATVPTPAPTPTTAPVVETPTAAPGPASSHVPIEDIVPNPEQPRRHFDDAALEELSASIRVHGLLQPLVVRRTARGWELIAGERRWRAAQRAGLAQVPVTVRVADGEDRLALALIENLQRENLNPMEEAEAYRRLASEYGLTQEEIARQVGKSRPAVANTMRLLGLPDEVRELVASGRLSAGHARAVLAIEGGSTAQVAYAHRLLAEGLSKAGAEKQAAARRTKPARKAPKLVIDVHLQALAEELTRGLGTRVKLTRHAGKGGTIEIEFYSDAQLDQLADTLRAAAASRSALL